jgi:hypothetical protein
MYVTQIKEALKEVYKDIKQDLIKFQDSDDFDQEVENVMILQLCELRKTIKGLENREEGFNDQPRYSRH